MRGKSLFTRGKPALLRGFLSNARGPLASAFSAPPFTRANSALLRGFLSNARASCSTNKKLF